MRPPVPTTTGAGSGLPVETTVTVGEPRARSSSGCAFVAPPGRNSCTRAVDVHGVADGDGRRRRGEDEDALGGRVVRVRGSGPAIQKPFVRRAVTMPFVETTSPTCGEMCAAPWMSWIAEERPFDGECDRCGAGTRLGVGDGARKGLRAGARGHGATSRRTRCRAACASPRPSSKKVCAPSRRSRRGRTSREPGARRVRAGRDGDAQQGRAAGRDRRRARRAGAGRRRWVRGARGAVVDVLRGAGAPAAKSAPLLSVSVQPPFARNAGRRVRERRRGARAFEEVRAVVADEVDDLRVLCGASRGRAAVAGEAGGGVGEDHLAPRRAHVDVPSHRVSAAPHRSCRPPGWTR